MSNPFTIAHLTLPLTIQQKAGFYGPQGWASEQIASLLQVSDDFIQDVFPCPTNSLSLTLFYNGLAVGHCNGNKWEDFIGEFFMNLQLLRQKTTHTNTITFLGLLDVIQYDEDTLLRQKLVSELEIPLDKIAHNAGLMVLKGYSSKENPLATKLVAEQVSLFKSQGFKAIVAETTSFKSLRAFGENGFLIFKSHKLSDFGIDIDDEYSILYKLL